MQRCKLCKRYGKPIAQVSASFVLPLSAPCVNNSGEPTQWLQRLLRSDLVVEVKSARAEKSDAWWLLGQRSSGKKIGSKKLQADGIKEHVVTRLFAPTGLRDIVSVILETIPS